MGVEVFMNEIVAMLTAFEERFYQWGPSLSLHSTQLCLFADGSGKLIVSLYNKDTTGEKEKFMAWIDPITKEFSFRTPEELKQILNNPLQWRHTET